MTAQTLTPRRNGMPRGDITPPLPAHTEELRPGRRIGPRQLLVGAAVGLLVLGARLPRSDDPLSVPGLRAWWEARRAGDWRDRDQVGSVTELAGSGAQVGQQVEAARPTYRVIDGQPILRFGPSSSLQVVDLPAVSTGAHTLFIVGRSALPSSPQFIFSFAGHGVAYQQVDGYWQPVNGEGVFMASGLPINVTTSLWVARADTSPTWGGGVDVRQNGTIVFRHRDTNSQPWLDQLATAAFIGADGVGQARNAFTGDILALALYDRPLSEPEIARVSSYFAGTYGLRLTQPSQVIAFDGNSLVVGAGSSRGLSDAVIRRLPHSVRAGNFAIGDQLTPHMIASAPALIDPFRDPLVNRNWLFAWEGSNHLRGGPATALEAYDALVTYCVDRRAAGWRVLLGTVLPRSDSDDMGDFETRRQQLNAMLRANWTTFADGLADIGADDLIGQPGQERNPTYYAADHLHLTAAGYERVADTYVTPGLRGLWTMEQNGPARSSG